tara:strand:- start:8203 stop:8637 length:435 start_codon:yes stop_codon:yes gene_type:complete
MNILFLCVGNSARSQIAEGLAKSMLVKEHNIKSAGSSPSGKVHPHAIKTMDDIGIDIRDQYSKSIDDLNKNFLDNLDYVITLCAEEVCPLIQSNATKLHWINVDPADKSYNNLELETTFKKTRKDIYNLLKKFFLSEIELNSSN